MPPLTAPKLTTREQEVLVLIRAGKSYGEIAERLGIAYNTVVTMKANILRKTGLHTRAELQAWRPVND